MPFLADLSDFLFMVGKIFVKIKNTDTISALYKAKKNLTMGFNPFSRRKNFEYANDTEGKYTRMHDASQKRPRPTPPHPSGSSLKTPSKIGFIHIQNKQNTTLTAIGKRNLYSFLIVFFMIFTPNLFN